MAERRNATSHLVKCPSELSEGQGMFLLTETISFRVSDEPQLATWLRETTKDPLVYTLQRTHAFVLKAACGAVGRTAVQL